MPESRRRTFGRMLYVLRKEAGYTQDALAKLLGFEGAQAVSAIEKGVRAPSFDMLFKIVDFFQTTVDAMTTGRCALSHGQTTFIDTSFSASDGSAMFIGTKDVSELGDIIDLFVRVRQSQPAPPDDLSTQ